MISNGLVTPAILDNWLQFTFRGLVAGMTTNEALPFKPLTIKANILALWLLLHLGLLLPLARLLEVCL